jgi:hypothetical protein
MKKFFVIIISIVVVSATFSSCKSHERCAAYGKINKIETEKTISDNSKRAI